MDSTELIQESDRSGASLNQQKRMYTYFVPSSSPVSYHEIPSGRSSLKTHADRIAHIFDPFALNMPLVKLVSSDGVEFPVGLQVAKMSTTVAGLMEALGDTVDEELFATNPIPLPNVDSTVLGKVIEWCDQHKDDVPKEETEEEKTRSDNVSEWDQEFLKAVDQKTLFGLITAANYLDIPGLTKCTCKTVANMMKGKTAPQIREFFHIFKDITDEEEAQIRRENTWGEEQ